MGWDTYFAFGSHYNEATILEQASQMRTQGLIKDGYDYLWLDVGWWQGARNAAGEITVEPDPVAARDGVADAYAARSGAEGGPVHRRGHQRLRRQGAGQLRPLPAGREHVRASGASTRSRWTSAGAFSRASTRRARTRNSMKRSCTTPATVRCCSRCATTCSPASTKAKSRRSKTPPSTPTRSGRAWATAGAPTPTWACRATWSSARCCATSTRTPPTRKPRGPATGTTPTTSAPTRGCRRRSSARSSACGRCWRRR